MTKEPWSFDDAVQWERLALEAQQKNDVIIGPYLDNRSLWRRLIALFCAASQDMHANACYLCPCRGRGKAMTQKTFSLLWWSRWHLGWADHVFKVGVLIFFLRCILNAATHFSGRSLMDQFDATIHHMRKRLFPLLADGYRHLC